MKIKDEHEGAGDFHLAHDPDQLNVSILPGFNAAMYCATGASGDRALMSSRFGERLIKVNSVREFAKHIAHRIGATDYHAYDLVHTDQKIPSNLLRVPAAKGEFPKNRCHPVHRSSLLDFIEFP
jgi:hypothetical protein